MEMCFSRVQRIREKLETVAFLISKEGLEKEAHSKIVESLVLLSQLEDDLEKVANNSSRDSIEVSVPTLRSQHGQRSNPRNEADSEIKKVTRRLPRWFRNSRQQNSTILYTFLRLSENNRGVSLQVLRSECQTLNDFDGNYNQMKNFGEKNHGKVFDERDGYVTLWDPIKEYVLKLYNENREQQVTQDGLAEA